MTILNPFNGGSSELIGWLVAAVTKAITAFFAGLVNTALGPLLTLLGRTLLTTPDPATMPRVGQLWESSRQIAVAAYALVIALAGITVMAYETLHTRQSVKEIAPRVLVGFVAANLSLLLAGKAVAVANAVSLGLLGRVDARSAADALTSVVVNAVAGQGPFVALLGLALAAILVALLVTYVVRVAVTVVLIAAAPLALICLALPGTEGVARWWVRTFAAALAIQLAQSLTLVAAMNVFLTKGGFVFFGATGDGVANLIVIFALLYLLYKIPFWILHAVHGSGSGRSHAAGLAGGWVGYKTLGRHSPVHRRRHYQSVEPPGRSSAPPAALRPGGQRPSPRPRGQSAAALSPFRLGRTNPPPRMPTSDTPARRRPTPKQDHSPGGPLQRRSGRPAPGGPTGDSDRRPQPSPPPVPVPPRRPHRGGPSTR